MQDALTDFIRILVGGISQMASGIGTGVQEAVTKLFLATNESGTITGLSTFGGVTAIFAGVSLAVGFISLIFYWIQNIGK